MKSEKKCGKIEKADNSLTHKNHLSALALFFHYVKLFNINSIIAITPSASLKV
jgi:hypothetical protein